MRKFWMTAATMLALGAADAGAMQTASDVAGARTTPASCYGALVARSADESGSVYNVDLDGKVRVAEVQIRLEGDRLSIIDDRKIEYYRILGPDKVEYMGYDNRASGPAARLQTTVWHSCG
jgi:hypothetical protein